jgi:DNA-binding CsgD family transcriptional regulator
MATSLKHEMSIEEIAAAEGTTVGAVNMLLSRALKKLRASGLLMTASELARELDRNRKGIVE